MWVLDPDILKDKFREVLREAKIVPAEEIESITTHVNVTVVFPYTTTYVYVQRGLGKVRKEQRFLKREQYGFTIPLTIPYQENVNEKTKEFMDSLNLEEYSEFKEILNIWPSRDYVVKVDHDSLHDKLNMKTIYTIDV